MEVWTQWVPCKVNVTPSRAPLRSYFHDPLKNETYFLNVHMRQFCCFLISALVCLMFRINILYLAPSRLCNSLLLWNTTVESFSIKHFLFLRCFKRVVQSSMIWIWASSDSAWTLTHCDLISSVSMSDMMGVLTYSRTEQFRMKCSRVSSAVLHNWQIEFIVDWLHEVLVDF